MRGVAAWARPSGDGAAEPFAGQPELTWPALGRPREQPPRGRLAVHHGHLHVHQHHVVAGCLQHLQCHLPIAGNIHHKTGITQQLGLHQLFERVLFDPQPARAMTAMHDAPQTAWSLAALAAKAGMSRARFAAAFKDAVGVTPGDYLADWRMNVSCTLVKQGRPVAVVADRVGYGSPNALARAFRVRMGCAPRDWLAQQRGDAALSGS